MEACPFFFKLTYILPFHALVLLPQGQDTFSALPPPSGPCGPAAVFTSPPQTGPSDLPVDQPELNSLTSHITISALVSSITSLNPLSTGIAQNFLDEALSQSSGFLSPGPTLPRPDATGQRRCKHPPWRGCSRPPAGQGRCSSPSPSRANAKPAAFCLPGPVTP